MFNSNDLLARIQAGENPEDIANEFAKQLNDVIALDQKQKAAEAAAKKEAEEKAAKDAKLDACVQKMADALNEYISLSHPDLHAALDEEDLLDLKDLRTSLDAALASVSLALSIANVATAKTDTKATKSPDDAISQFLKNFGL